MCRWREGVLAGQSTHGGGPRDVPLSPIKRSSGPGFSKIIPDPRRKIFKSHRAIRPPYF